jgi:membrane protein
MRRTPGRLFAFYWGQGIVDDVPALTYYLLLSLAPFALGMAALEALFLDDIVGAVAVSDQINRFLPEEVHGDVRGLVVGAHDNSIPLLLLAVGAMLWTSSGAIGVIERCESRLLDTERHDIVRGRVRNLALGVMVALTVIAGAAGAPVIGDAASRFDLRGSVPNGLLLAGNTLGSIVVFAFIYRNAPRSRLRWRSALVGAMPAGIVMQGVPVVIGLYFGAAAGIAPARIFLLLAVLLLGLYVMAMVVLIGAGVAVAEERRARHQVPIHAPVPGAPQPVTHP